MHGACTRYDEIVEQHGLEGIAKLFTEVAAAKPKVMGRQNVVKRCNLGMLVNQVPPDFNTSMSNAWANICMTC